ncbi:uncharacterized protein LOC131643007 [Vicia villosa]|uniref:uncharacterized protein LOC131643007 n=1 Tax=Vicia villosa TaxID=3911 RepID=UPI00273ABD62|nr:uncharacterized protein LOC131643007 [Vicia villosa]
MVVGRNGDSNVEALTRWTGAIGQVPQESADYGGKDEFSALGDFRRCNPSIFEGGTHMLTKGVEDWWSDTVQRFKEEGIEKEVKFLKLKRERGQSSGKPYDEKRKQTGVGKKLSGGGTSTPIKCFRFGIEGHRTVDCGKNYVTCFKCKKIGHKANKCRIGSSATCYNCGERGHISSKYDKPKKEQAEGKAFALPGVETTAKERLI